MIRKFKFIYLCHLIFDDFGEGTPKIKLDSHLSPINSKILLFITPLNPNCCLPFHLNFTFTQLISSLTSFVHLWRCRTSINKFLHETRKDGDETRCNFPTWLV